jgi:dienelactone hydrolase
MAEGAYQTYKGPDGTEIKSYYVAPDKPRGAVILLRGVAGPDSGYTEIADRLSASGYAALVHTWQVRGNDVEDATLLGDIAAAIAFLKARSELAGREVALFGYCKGGGFAVLAAARNRDVAAVVAFHGRRLPRLRAPARRRDRGVRESDRCRRPRQAAGVAAARRE